MLSHVILAGLAAGIPGIFTSWLITGLLFHPYQRATTQTWRANEGPAQYVAASILTVLAAFVISALFAATGGIHGHMRWTGITNGVIFGAMCWGALAVPVLLSVATFVNVHRAVIVGLLLDWLVVSLLAGGMASWFMAH